jgi:hypothetical protein
MTSSGLFNRTLVTPYNTIPVFRRPGSIFLQISEKFRATKEDWHKDPDHHGSEEIPPPPAKRWGQEQHCPLRCADTYRALAIGCISKKNQEMPGQQVLVLPGAEPYDLSCFTAPTAKYRPRGRKRGKERTRRSSCRTHGGRRGSSDS